MVRPVDQLDLKIDHRITSQRATRRRVPNPLLNRRPPLLWNCPTKYPVNKLEAFATWQRRKDTLTISKLAAPACLLLVAPLDLDTPPEGFTVWNLRRMEHHLDVVAIFQFRDDRFDVLLAGTSQLEFTGLLIMIVVELQILLQQLMNRN